MLNITHTLKVEGQRIDKLEKMLGKGLYQPFNNLNSSSRKVMLSAQLEQILPLFKTETPLIQTGFEDEFGRYNTSFVTADSDYTVIHKIPRYTVLPNGRNMSDHNYILIYRDNITGKYGYIERKFGEHTTETYGFLYNNEYMDSLQPNMHIPKGDVVKKSESYSDFNNREDGINLRTCYMCIHDTTEDGIVVSRSAAEKLKSPLFKKVQVVINDNDIPINLYGNEHVYKPFPDIGENINNGVLCGIRRESKDEALYSLSWDRLRHVMPSDEKYTLNGRVIDINMYCNNPQKLEESAYYTQLDSYYKDSLRFSKDIVNALYYIVESTPDLCSYELLKLYQFHDSVIKGKKYMGDNKPFSNVVIEFLILDIYELDFGDKLSDRYGGKGVVSRVMPDELMPRTQSGEIVEMIINAIGPVGRENPGQLSEVSTNFINECIVACAYDDTFHHADEFIEIYLQFLDMVSPTLKDYVSSVIKNLEDREKFMFISSLNGGMVLSLLPVSESIDLDKLAAIYEKFSWITPSKLKVPIVSSTGEIRYVDSRRPITVGKKYIYRLQQYSEDKFSATSLSTTNIKNEPVKSRASKYYKAPYPKTPVRFGDMETGNMLHILNTFSVVENLMIHSTSPKARRGAEKLLTGNPFDTDLRINKDAVSRNVEILNTYLKAIGLRLIFRRVKKKKVCPVSIRPVTVRTNPQDDYEYEYLLRPLSIKKKGDKYKYSPVTFRYDPLKPAYICPVNVTIKGEDD